MTVALILTSAALVTFLLAALFALTGNAVDRGVWVTGREIARYPQLGEWALTSDTCYLPLRVVQMVRTRASDRGLVGAQPEALKDFRGSALRQRAPETREETEA